MFIGRLGRVCQPFINGSGSNSENLLVMLLPATVRDGNSTVFSSSRTAQINVERSCDAMCMRHNEIHVNPQ
jgi:hypothetical protein